MKLDNNIYSENKVFNKDNKEIFKGDFQELKQFMKTHFNLKLTDNENMEVYEDFGDRDFKIELGFFIDPEFLKSLESAASAESKLEKIYDKVFGKFTIDEIVKMIKSREILNFTEQFVDEIPKNFDNPYEANYFIFDTVESFIDMVLAQTYYKHLENGGIIISFPPNTDLNFEDFMFTTELFAAQENNEYYIFEKISGQGETFYHIYNIKDGKLSEKVWKEIIEYSKALNALNETYKERINETN